MIIVSCSVKFFCKNNQHRVFPHGPNILKTCGVSRNEASTELPSRFAVRKCEKELKESREGLQDQIKREEESRLNTDRLDQSKGRQVNS